MLRTLGLGHRESADIDPDGYSVSLQAPSLSFSQQVSAGLDGSVTFERLRPADDYHLSLNEVSANCTVTGGSIQAFTVNPGTTTHATFAVSCETIRLLASSKRTTSTEGSNGSGSPAYDSCILDGDPRGPRPGKSLCDPRHSLGMSGCVNGCTSDRVSDERG